MHPYKYVIFLLTFSFIIIFINSCVDTSVQNISPIDYKSQIQFVNLANNVGSAAILVDGQSFGTLNFGDELPGGYREISSGSKSVVIDYSAAGVPNDTFKVVFETERKMRVFIIGDASSRSFVKVHERYIWQTKDSKEGANLFPPDTFKIMIFHGAPGVRSIGSVRIKVATKDTTVALPLSYGKASSYIALRAGLPYTFIAYSDRGDSLSSVNLTPEARRAYTAVLYGSPGAIRSKVFIND